MSLRDHIERKLKTGMTYTAKELASAFHVSLGAVQGTLRKMQAEAAPGDHRPRVVFKHRACPVWGWGVLPDYGTPELEAHMRTDIQAVFDGELGCGSMAMDLLLEYVK